MAVADSTAAPVVVDSMAAEASMVVAAVASMVVAAMVEAAIGKT